MNHTRFHQLWQDPDVARRFATAVSLHSHTMHSRESIDSIVHHVRGTPGVRRWVRSYEEGYRRNMGHAIDYSRAYWTPPLPARNAFELEKRQIDQVLGLQPLIALTDHDAIDAALEVRAAGEAGTPISLEWTLPFGPSFFHLGVHNLPARGARGWVGQLAAYTGRPSAHTLENILAGLNEVRESLVVLNHPLWDEPGLGAARHGEVLAGFLDRFGRWVHALEINGQRNWSENREVMSMARDLGFPAVSGGDRHGSEPSAILNLTNAATFDEFAAEVRYERRSEVLFMPQYRDSYRMRMLECAWDILREYPELTGRERWTDRTFYRGADGCERSLSSYWGAGAPGFLRCAFSVVRMSQNRRLRPALRLAFGWPGEAIS